MSLFNSVLGSVSPRFRDSFEDSRAQEHELPLYRTASTSPRIPPPVASTILWNAPTATSKISPPARVPDDLLALQRRARHLEQQLQQLLDDQADGLMSGLAGNEGASDDLVSNGSTTPTVSSIRGTDRSTENEQYTHGTSSRRKKVSLNAARRGISRRIQQLASIKADELDILDSNLTHLHSLVTKTSTWTEKRTRLEKKISSIQSDSSTSTSHTASLQAEASSLSQQIRQKEEELWALKARHRRVLNDLSDTQNALEAKLSTYKASLSILDKDIASFLARPPETNHIPLSTSPFMELPAKRRTLEMAHEYWEEESTRLTEKCQQVDVDRAALDEGVMLWNDVVNKVAEFETRLQSHMQQSMSISTAGARDSSNSNSNGSSSRRSTSPPDPAKLVQLMDTTVAYLEAKLAVATDQGWNLLVCAIGAELEAFKQGRDILEEALGLKKRKATEHERLVDTTDGAEQEEEQEEEEEEKEEEAVRSAIRIGRTSPAKSSVAAPPPPTKFFDTDDEDPDPELMISHQDTDTD